MKLRVTVLAFAAFCLLSVGALSAQSICDNTPGNLVTNCGFETGDFTGWTQGGDTSFTGVDTEANSGTFAAFMGPTNSNGTLSQAVGDNSTSYFVSFFLANDGGTPNNFTVFWNGVDVGPDLVDADAFGYTEFSGVLAGNAGAGSNTLEFSFFQEPAFWHLDDVVVLNQQTTTPEPGSLILFGSGILGLAGVIRRKLSL